MSKKILVVMSHPDDESFGPGGTIAKYASLGVEIHLLCASRGESGEWQNQKGRKLEGQKVRTMGEVREKEHAKAAEILGIGSVEYLDYIDGTLNNGHILYGEITNKIVTKAKQFKPDILLTFDLAGISGHGDHMIMAVATTKAFDLLSEVKKLYYYEISKDQEEYSFKKHGRRVFGKVDGEITTFIDVRKYLSKKIEAASCHKTQAGDFERLKLTWEQFGNRELFILGRSRVKTKFPEEDLFEGI